MDDCSLGCQRLIRASPTSSFPSLVGGKETKFRMSAVGFSDDASYCWSRVNLLGRSHVVAVT